MVSLFSLFGKKSGENTVEKSRKKNDLMKLEIYSGMRVVVERPGGQMLFIARLQNLDIDAAVVLSNEKGVEESLCKLLNISVGGASISSEHRYHKGDTFILKVNLSENSIPSVLYCEVLRVMEKKVSGYEYGCRFLELTEADQEKIEKILRDGKK